MTANRSLNAVNICFLNCSLNPIGILGKIQKSALYEIVGNKVLAHVGIVSDAPNPTLTNMSSRVGIAFAVLVCLRLHKLKIPEAVVIWIKTCVYRNVWL